EVFYIKDCVIAKTGLPAQRVSTEVLGAYKECEAAPNRQTQGQQTSQKTMQPIQQQQYNSVAQSNAGGYGQRLNPTNLSPLPVRQQGFSQQYFVLYPRPPFPPQQQFSTTTQQQIPVNFNQATGQEQFSTATQEQQITGQRLSAVTQQQMPVDFKPASAQQQFSKSTQQQIPINFNQPTAQQQFSIATEQQHKTKQQPSEVTQKLQMPINFNRPISQQPSIPFTNQQQIPVSSYAPQTQFQQGIKTAQVQSQQNIYSSSQPLTPMMSHQPPQSPFIPVPNGAYYYGFQIKH
ncbi:hypothetical protein JTE90_023415, partial [Oedothorax gibbosus]